MDYNKLEKVRQTWHGKICLLSIGAVGPVWAYDLVKKMGFQVDFYCRKGKPCIEITDDIKTVSVEFLYSLKEEVLVFIMAADQYQLDLRMQLETNGIHNIVCMDFYFLQVFCEHLRKENNPELNERFKYILNDAEYLSRQFQYYLGKWPDLDNPKTFNEKLQWLKLHDRNPNYTQLVDKSEVKKYAAEKIGAEHIIPTLGIYHSFDEIDFENLPDQFVLKCTHDSGSAIIVDDKAAFDSGKARRLYNHYLERNYFYSAREWSYLDVKPKIIVEEYLGKGIRDYKIYNFNGKAKMIQIDFDRYEKHTRNFYSVNWKKINLVMNYPENLQTQVEKPQQLKKIIELAEILSKDKPFVRTDFFYENEKIYFGEMTFYPEAGYCRITPQSMDDKMGEELVLPD